MKKFITLLIIGLSSSTLLLSTVAFGEEYKGTKATEISDVWEEVLKDLDENNYGGAYLDGNTLHIKPVKTEEIQNIVESASIRTRTVEDINIVVDEEVMYSIQELKDAKAKIADYADELKLCNAGIDDSKNSITVGSIEWTEEKKQIIENIAGVDNIIFVEETHNNNLNHSNIEQKNINVPDNISDTEQRSSELYVGDRINSFLNRKFVDSATLGACVKRGDKKGYITTSHSAPVGASIYLNNDPTDQSPYASEYLGKVQNPTYYGPNIDVSFVERDPSSNYNLTNIVRLRFGTNVYKSGGLNYNGVPAVQNAAVLFGQGSGYRIAIIEETDFDDYFSGKHFYNLIKMDLPGEGGDSGGPVMTPQGPTGEEFALVGIFKGTTADGYGVASRWDYIQKELGVKLY